MDIISKLPTGVIETILCLLPIQEAARTSILSKEWRYRWIKIPKLEFNEDTFRVSTNRTELSSYERAFDKPSKREKMYSRWKLFYAICQVLLMHESPIHEFTLCVELEDSCAEIDHIIRYLMKKNTVKIFKLDFGYNFGWYELPVPLFSLHQLTNMYLDNCALPRERSFNEFGCLTTLSLKRIKTYDETLVRLLSSCPVLKRLTLHCSCADIIYTGCTSVVDLFKCFLGIESLSIFFNIILTFELKRVPKELPTTLIHLKYLCMERMCFSHKDGLPFLVLLIRCSPNLEKLILEIDNEDWLEEDDMGSFTVEDYPDIMLEHLNELEILHFRNFDSELDFVKVILAKSPVLKKVKILPCSGCNEDEESHLLKTLSCSPFASPVVKLVVWHY